jgi:predicted Zn-dependent protease
MKKSHHRNSQRGSVDMPVIISFFALFLSIGVAFIYFSLYGGSRPVNSVVIFQKVFDSASSIKTYSAHILVQPEGTAPAMPMFEGDTFFDIPGSQMSATFEVPVSAEKGAAKISVRTVFSDGKKFVKIRAMGGSPIFPDDWILVNTEGDVPKELERLETAGALFDALEIFRKGKEYAIINGDITKEKIGGTDEVRFVLHDNPAKKLPPEMPEKLASLLRDGQINVWATQEDGELKEIRFSLNKYTITISITGTNKRSDILSPKTSVSQNEWKAKQFALAVPKEAVTEVLIGSYGDIKKEYLEGVRSAVQKATGVKTTVMGSGAPLNKKAPLYDSARQQFDADALFKSIEAVSAKYGPANRFIYVFDAAMYSSSDPDRKPVWYAEKHGGNAALVSVYDLQKKSDSATTPAAPPLVISRLQKISLHVLGTSVGFSFSPSVSDKKCLMYPAGALAELDAQGSGYCAPEKGVVSKVFKK